MTTFASARAQCLRGLNIIDKSQLTIFLQRELTPHKVLVERLDALQSEPLEVALEGMRAILSETLTQYSDPFANYINPKQHSRYAERRKGGFVGLGLKFRAKAEDYPLVIGALLGGPLEHQDIKPGDNIVAVGSHDMFAKSAEAVREAMVGEPGSSVDLLLERDSGTRITVRAQRQSVKLSYVRAERLADNIGFLKMSRFGGNTHVRFQALLNELLSQGEPLKGLVLDLRDNPGGSTLAARNIMSMFEKAPWVYCERYKSGAVQRLPRKGDWLTDVPLAVLVNEHSMSSAEIVAGALQDYGRAVLVGAPTYGKGLIQKVFPLEEPLGGAVRVTIAMYGTPNHRLLHGRGLVPDIYVPTAPAGLFVEGGSLNISDEARLFKRQLLLDSLGQTYSPSEVTAYRHLPDVQLNVAVAQLTR